MSASAELVQATAALCGPQYAKQLMRELREWSPSEPPLSELEERFQEPPEDLEKAKAAVLALNYRADIMMRSPDYLEEALRLLLLAETVCESVTAGPAAVSPLLALTMNQLSTFYRIRGKLHAAEQVARRALALQRRHKLFAVMPWSHLNLAAVASASGRHVEALGHCHLAIAQLSDADAEFRAAAAVRARRRAEAEEAGAVWSDAPPAALEDEGGEEAAEGMGTGVAVSLALALHNAAQEKDMVASAAGSRDDSSLAFRRRALRVATGALGESHVFSATLRRALAHATGPKARPSPEGGARPGTTKRALPAPAPQSPAKSPAKSLGTPARRTPAAARSPPREPWFTRLEFVLPSSTPAPPPARAPGPGVNGFPVPPPLPHLDRPPRAGERVDAPQLAPAPPGPAPAGPLPSPRSRMGPGPHGAGFVYVPSPSPPSSVWDNSLPPSPVASAPTPSAAVPAGPYGNRPSTAPAAPRGPGPLSPHAAQPVPRGRGRQVAPDGGSGLVPPSPHTPSSVASPTPSPREEEEPPMGFGYGFNFATATIPRDVPARPSAPTPKRAGAPPPLVEPSTPTPPLASPRLSARPTPIAPFAPPLSPAPPPRDPRRSEAPARAAESAPLSPSSPVPRPATAATTTAAPAGPPQPTPPRQPRPPRASPQSPPSTFLYVPRPPERSQNNYEPLFGRQRPAPPPAPPPPDRPPAPRRSSLPAPARSPAAAPKDAAAAAAAALQAVWRRFVARARTSAALGRDLLPPARLLPRRARPPPPGPPAPTRPVAEAFPLQSPREMALALAAAERRRLKPDDEDAEFAAERLTGAIDRLADTLGSMLSPAAMRLAPPPTDWLSSP